MKYTLQVAPEDCTGCGCASRSARPRTRARSSTRPSTWRPSRRCARPKRANWDFFLNLPETDRKALTLSQVKDVQLLQPLFEFSGACAGCGETPYIKLLTQLFGDRAADRQRHRLLLDLRRQPAHHARTARTATAAARPGPTRSSRTTPSSAWACAWPSTSRTSTPASWSWRLSAVIGDEPGAGLLDADQSTEAGIDAQRERVKALQGEAGGRQYPEARDLAPPGRHAGEEERLDRRRRRLGLRHRLRRPGPRPGLRPQRQRPGARHRGLLQHRRPDVQGHAARRRGQVRRRRQAGRRRRTWP